MGLADASGIGILAMGKTIVHSLWIGMLILALLRVVLLQIPTLNSRKRYRISVSALILLFCSVIITFIVIYEPVVHDQDAFTSGDLLPPFAGSLLTGKQGNTAISLHSLFTVFGYLYLAGVLAMLFRSLVSLSYVRHLRSSGALIDPDWQARFRQLSSSLSIKRPVKLLQSSRVKGPLLVGLLKPVVIIPVGMLTNLPASQIETILMHELYHLKRSDYLVNLMQLFIEGLLFYHPAVWIISGIVRNEREHCCDDGVIRETSNPVNYAKALIHIAEQQEYTRLAPGAVGPAKYSLKSRIYRILNRNAMKTNLRDRVLSLALLAGSLILLVTISGFNTGPSFFRYSNLNSEQISRPQSPPLVMPAADTIPQKAEAEENEEMEEARREALEEIEEEIEEARREALEEIEEIDWEEMEEEMEEARREALEEIEEIDWEEMKEEMEEARREALEEIEEIDWEEMKEEIEEAHREALEEIEEIDWEEMKEEMEEARREALEEIEEIDWEEIKEEVEEARREALEEIEEIDWEEIKAEMKIDMEEMKMEIEKSMKEIDWDQIKKEMAESMAILDSIRIELDH